MSSSCISVGIDDKPVWAEVFGYASLEHAVPVTPMTRFRSGSVSKTSTSIALKLQQEGLLAYTPRHRRSPL